VRTPRIRLAIITIAVMCAGCQSLLYELQPHRLRRLNRHPAPSMDPEFSAIAPDLKVQPVQEVKSSGLRLISPLSR
jgi:hypothetical protein